MTYESSSAASDVSLAPFGLRIIRAMQPSAARGETAECAAKRKLAQERSECWIVAIRVVTSGRPKDESARQTQPGTWECGPSWSGVLCVASAHFIRQGENQLVRRTNPGDCFRQPEL